MYLNKQNFKTQISGLAQNYRDALFLLAVSGGADSMVLLYLFNDLKLNFQVAHVNYKLRGNESDLDEKIVRDFCFKNNIKFHFYSVSEEDTKPKNSIQLWARNLRYKFFNEIRLQEKLDYIVTAHHLNDELETFLINLSRASGLKGLSGIPADQNEILRPLLKFKKSEIYIFADTNNIDFREDKSNQKSDYLRNFIRNEVTPKLLESNTDFLENFSKSLTYLSEADKFIDAQIQEKRNSLSKTIDGNIIFNIEILAKETDFAKLQILKKYGFKDKLEIEKIFKSESGSRFISTEYELKVSSRELIIKALNERENNFEPQIILKADKIRISDFLIDYQEVGNVWEINSDKVTWPLIIRSVTSEDIFNPIGMKGKKKVKKFIRDLKLSLNTPEIFVLADSKEQILGVLPFRQNGLYSVEKGSACLKVSI